MSSHFPKLILLAAAALIAFASEAEARELRVCADPNNMPFSNSAGQGFENRIAAVVADDMHADLSFAWVPQWRGFVRKGLNAHVCDVVVGVPSDLKRLLTTKPYYEASYVFVQKHGAEPITSFDDAGLKRARVGVQLVGNDAANTPPMDELARRGLTGNVHGYMVYGDWSKPNPLEPIVGAVATGDIDVAVVWGPAATYFARRAEVPLEVTPITTPTATRMSFDISMGVRKGDTALASEIDTALVRRRADIDAILADYGIAPSPMKAATREGLTP